MEISKIKIDKDYRICLDDFEAVTKNGKNIELSNDSDYVEIINKGNRIIKDCIKNNIPIYGVTTGFGDSCRRQISYNDAKTLQANLVKYHGCGIGAYFSPSETLGIMLLRLISNARGYSGVRYDLLKQIEQFVNKKILPLIPEQGSVGASGDLTPLSYLAATLTGQRKVLYNDEVIDASEALKITGLEPITLESKEGLALMNGTSVMCSIASFCVIDAKKIAKLLELTTAMTVEVLEGNKDSFAPIIHRNKPFEGQNKCADTIYNYLKSSNSAMKYNEIISIVLNDEIERGNHIYLDRHIQDKYSLRCAPHIIGVLFDTLKWCEDWVVNEMNSVTDNPLIDYETGEIYSGGNFYGGHICSSMDSLRATICNVADLVDKQLELIIDEKFNCGLTPNLIDANTDKPYIRHGLKAVQITATSLVAEMMSLANPISSLSRPTEALNQDKVSLGTISARHTRNIIQLMMYLISIQLISLCQAIELRGISKFSYISKEVFSLVRTVSKFVSDDRELDTDIENVKNLLLKSDIYDIISKYSL